MKTKIFVLCASALFLCSACSKDDKVDLDVIVGEWYWDTTYPYLIMDVSMSYTFKKDGKYIKTVYGGESPAPSFTEGRYVTSITDKPRLLTLFTDDEEGREVAVEQYNIRKLNSKEILLESTSDEASPREMRLLRAEYL
ncbi:MAG: hypothetical protein LIO85_03455 [Rikenellaceae bacterium]|nr:hypothetical protein [Rikenellaceae bacterium]